MTTEAEARARLLAHCESKLAMLKEHVATLAGKLATKTDVVDRRAYMAPTKVRGTEIATLGWNIAKVREGRRPLAHPARLMTMVARPEQMGRTVRSVQHPA